MDVLELKCFGQRAGEGNRALVVRHDGLDEAGRLAFARQRQAPACVFVSGDATPVLDFYYPHLRSPLCLHATLAAAEVLLAGQPGPLSVRTAMRGQELQLSQRDGLTYVKLQRQSVPPAVPAEALALRLLGRLPDGSVPTLASAPAIASVGSPKLLLEVDGPATLQALQPDLPAIADWGRASQVSGVYGWCRRADGALEGRNFNHLDPLLEDAATGVAAGALTVLLGQPIRLHQGANRAQPCLLHTAIEGDHILIGGLVMQFGAK